MTSEDVSKRAVLVLVVLAVVVSVLSTSLVLNAVYQYAPDSVSNLGGGDVFSESESIPSEAAPSQAVGLVEIKVVNP